MERSTGEDAELDTVYERLPVHRRWLTRLPQDAVAATRIWSLHGVFLVSVAAERLFFFREAFIKHRLYCAFYQTARTQRRCEARGTVSAPVLCVHSATEASCFFRARLRERSLEQCLLHSRTAAAAVREGSRIGVA